MLSQEIHSFNELYQAVTKILHVRVDPKQVKILKSAGYSLCVAKKVGDTFNVVWKSNSKFLVNNTVKYAPLYQLQGTNTYENGLIQTDTDAQECGLGQTCTLDEFGILGAAITGGPEISLTLKNEYAPIHAVVNQIINGSTLPCYVAKQPTITGSESFTPKDSIQVWFSRSLETSSIFTDAQSNVSLVDLTTTNNRSIEYNEDGKWVVT